MTKETRPSPDAPPWSYWVVPGSFLGGCFPGNLDEAEQTRRLEQLLDAGIRVFVNLMEQDERNRLGQPFGDYAARVRELARARGLDVEAYGFRSATSTCLRRNRWSRSWRPSTGDWSGGRCISTAGAGLAAPERSSAAG